MSVKLPYIKWRDGRPRLVHGPRERAMGMVDIDLRHDNGRGSWFTYEETATFAATHHKEVLAARASGQRIRPEKQRGNTVEDLIDDWLSSTEVQNLKPHSVQSYQKAARAVIYRPETREQAAVRREKERAAAVLGVKPPVRAKEPIASVTPTSLEPPELRAFFNYLKAARGHHMALAAIAALSAALTWGRESSRWRLTRNPRIDMQFERPAGRVVMVTMEEFEALVAAADAKGRWSIGDAIYLGLFTGQRQTDRLALKDEGLTPEGRRRFKQSKTGAICEIKQAPQLAARLDAARTRTTGIKLRLGLREMPDSIVVDESTGRSYNEHTYRHLFAEIRDLAIKGSNEFSLTPCPSLAFVNDRGEPDMKHDQDLRDTCVMLLDRAGNDLLSICDVTGHSYQSAQMIMKHYRSRNAMRADAAIDKLTAFISKEGY